MESVFTRGTVTILVPLPSVFPRDASLAGARIVEVRRTTVAVAFEPMHDGVPCCSRTLTSTSIRSPSRAICRDTATWACSVPTTVRINADKETSWMLRIEDVLGKTIGGVRASGIVAGNTMKDIPIDVGDLPSGRYVVVLESTLNRSVVLMEVIR